MREHRGLDAIRAPVTPRAVTTLGVFDGVHRGHQEILRRVVSLARETEGTSWMITFATHPARLLSGAAPPAIEPLDVRLARFARLGIEHVWVLDFDERLREIPADRFVSEVLVGRLGAAGIVLGEGARFGRGARGSIETLEELAPRHGFTVRRVPVMRVAGGRVSSTRIRHAVRGGDLSSARDLLGRPFAVFGRVVPGDGRGRRIGIPTANLEGPFALLPPLGVYFTRVAVRGGEWFGVTNIGVRPTFDGGSEPDRVTVETHLLDYDGDLVGERAEIRFLEYIREERRFPDVDSLVTRIRADVTRARERANAWKPRLENDLTLQRREL